jgi:Tfp pilus assembly major pilin PilA
VDTIEIILLSAVLTVLGVRLYQKYIKKNQGKTGDGTSSGSSFSSSSHDDYEPYSKK